MRPNMNDDSDDDGCDSDEWQNSQYPTLIATTHVVHKPPVTTTIFESKAAAKRVRSNSTKQKKVVKKPTLTTTTTTTTNKPQRQQQQTKLTTTKLVPQQQQQQLQPKQPSVMIATTSSSSSQSSAQWQNEFNKLDSKLNDVLHLVRKSTTSTSCCDFIAQADMFDVLLHREQLMHLCDQALSIWVMFCPGFQQFTCYSHCVFSQTSQPLQTQQMFLQQKTVFAVGQSLLDVYVLGWAQDTTRDPQVLNLNMIFQKNISVAKNILQFSLCVSNRLIT